MKNPFSVSPCALQHREIRLVSALALALAAGLTGCYHSTGFTRPNNLASEIPANGGDQVPGLKSAAGPGDYALANDLVSLAIDGTPFGEPEGTTIAGAVSGGSIVDIGVISLDRNYKRIPMESDLLERLTPVVNQDPDLPLVFSRFEPVNGVNASTLQLTGRVYDPTGKITGATRDGSGCLQGVEVNHTISLEQLGRRFLLETTLTNRTGAAIGIRNVGDALIQQGAGFRFNIPATQRMDGTAITAGWGVDVPGAGFSVDESVQAPMIGLMGTESAGLTTDFHTSLGMVSSDWKPLLVSTDPQRALQENRPVFGKRLVAGCQPVASLAPGASLTHRRWVYLHGAASSRVPMMSNGVYPSESSQTTAIFNDITRDRLTAQSQSIGLIQLASAGATSRTGSLQSVFRIEKKEGNGWRLERTESWEPLDISSANGSLTSFTLLVPEGQYRVVVSDALGRSVTMEQFHDQYAYNYRPDVVMPLVAKSGAPFMIPSTDFVSTDRGDILGSVDAVGSTTGIRRPAEGTLVLGTRVADTSTEDAGDGSAQAIYPARFTVQGVNVPNPDTRRFRFINGVYDVSYKQKLYSYGVGTYGFMGGNTLFGVRLSDGIPMPVPLQLPESQYRVFASHGPLAYVDVQDVTLGLMSSSTSSTLVTFDKGHPAGWVSFDLPAPSMATSGNMHPMEKLSSAMAEAVKVVGYTEEDRYSNVDAIRDEFRFELENPSLSTNFIKVIGTDPLLVGGRTSQLTGFGAATTLFTPSGNPTMRRNGARLPSGWTLADFLAQGGGTYHIVHRPRGPQGLFNAQHFDPTVALGQGVNAWWSTTSPWSMGKTHGAFDALELLCAASLDPANPDLWWQEFQQVRNDWFAILKQQTPQTYTKALGLSSARFSKDTPVGQARTYVKATDLTQVKLDAFRSALTTGAAVASTGPLLDVSIGGKGPGELASGGSVNLSITCYAPAWMPVEEVRVVVNGQVVQTLALSAFTKDATDARKYTLSVPLTVTQDSYVIVEAGAPLATTGVYQPGSTWHVVMKGIYPVAVTNPIFVDVDGGGYHAPGL